MILIMHTHATADEDQNVSSAQITINGARHIT